MSQFPASIPVAIYARVSTQSQVGGRFDSCESQVAICRDYIARNASMGWFELASYVDLAFSGGDNDRPGLRALRRAIEDGSVKAVLIYKFERLMRCTEGWGSFQGFLRRHGCRLISASEDICDRLPSGRLRNNLLVAVAEYERLNTGEKVRTKMLEQVKRGIWNCGQVPFGYDYDERAKLLFPNTEEASVVTRIYNQAACLMPVSSIARILTLQGIKTKARIFKRRDGEIQTVGGIAFRVDALKNLIANPIYSGRLRFKGQTFTGNHPPLVEVDLWERANAALARSAGPKQRTFRGAQDDAHLLNGIVHCQICSRAMVRVTAGRRPDGQRYRYYVCEYARTAKAGVRCRTGNVPATALESALVKIIGHCGSHPGLMTTAIRESQQQGNTDAAAWQVDLTEVNKALADIELHTANCVQAIASGDFQFLEEELFARIAGMAVEKQGHLVKRERLSQQLNATNLEESKIETMRATAQSVSQALEKCAPSESRELIQGALAWVGLELRNDKDSLGLNVKLRVPDRNLSPTEGESLRGLSTNGRPTRPVSVKAQVTNLGCEKESYTYFPGPSAISISPPDVNRAPPEIERLHPLHRALKWGMRLRAEPSLKRTVLAQEESVCPATITHHLKLLRLAPEIQVRLLGVLSAEDLEKYSLNKMKALACLPVHEQLQQFGRN